MMTTLIHDKGMESESGYQMQENRAMLLEKVLWISFQVIKEWTTAWLSRLRRSVYVCPVPTNTMG
jgi:hypothetical protein